MTFNVFANNNKYELRQLQERTGSRKNSQTRVGFGATKSAFHEMEFCDARRLLEVGKTWKGIINKRIHTHSHNKIVFSDVDQST
jgi:hypothetical protein